MTAQGERNQNCRIIAVALCSAGMLQYVKCAGTGSLTSFSLVPADQVALLVAGINYVLEVETTLGRVDNGDNSALTGYHDLQVRES